MKTTLPFYRRSFLVLLLLITGLFNAFSQDLVVAKDGSGNFTTVQAAINAAPSGRTTPFVIFIKNGKYKEKINIPSNKTFIQLIGESVANVILTFDDFSGKPMPGGGTFGTSNSASFTVTAADFTAINITFENTTGESPQALAIYVTGDRSAFKNCRFLGGQDTVFSGQPNSATTSRQYFRNCYIDGTVDFIFGDARAVFDSCIIYAKTRSNAGSSYITAANTKAIEPYGYVFRDIRIPANRGGTQYFYGRPWQNDVGSTEANRSHNKTVFLNATISSVILPAGWSTWNTGTNVSTITYAEYKTKNFDGTPANISQRVSWSKQLTDEQAAVYYNNDSLFGTWNPCNVYPGFCTSTAPDIAVSNFNGVRGPSLTTFTWNISWPVEGIKYEVMRSADRSVFAPVNEQISANDTAVNFSYVEAVPPPGQTYYYIIRATKPGYSTHITDTVTISSKPTIIISGSMGSFLQGVGTPSAPQAYTLRAENLTDSLKILVPAPYEISFDGTMWFSSTLPQRIANNTDGTIASQTIFVRLNGNTAGTYSGSIVHTSPGADTINAVVSGTIQQEPLVISEVLQWYPMSTNNTDSAAIRKTGVQASTSSFQKFAPSNGVSIDGAALPAYSDTHGQAVSGIPEGTGSWRTNLGGPGSTLNPTYYEQFTIAPEGNYNLKVDSLILSSSFYASSSSTRIAIRYSTDGFVSDSAEISGGTVNGSPLTFVSNNNFTKAVALPNESSATTNTLRFALNNATGINVPAGKTLYVRLYFSCGSTSYNRYAKVKNLMFKGNAESADPLPLNLLSFNGAFDKNKVELQWITVNEVDVAHYEVERSLDGVHFSVIGKQRAVNLTLRNVYHFADAKPFEGVSFYRLKLYDKDNSFKYSKVITVNSGLKSSFSIFPNPATVEVTFVHDKATMNAEAQVVNLRGQIIKRVKVVSGSHQTTINVQELQTGSYILRYLNGGNSLQKTFLKN